MIYMFVSDIHGNVDKFDEILEIFEKENADKLLILGDTSSDYSKSDNEIIAQKLNKIKNKVQVIIGNCDKDDFIDLLDFDTFDIDNLYANGKTITVTHGNRYNFYDLPPFCGDIFIQGHTHVPILKEEFGKILANPGSVSRPRGIDLRCYIILNNNEIILKTLDGNIVKKTNFK